MWQDRLLVYRHGGKAEKLEYHSLPTYREKSELIVQDVNNPWRLKIVAKQGV